MITNQNTVQNNHHELLLPVGHKDMALAAIHNGADAIFVGFPGWNARGRSYDHELSELKEIIEVCHHYGVKVNLAFNILIFENEMNSVIEDLKQVMPLKPDVLIIQDLGLAQVVRQMYPQQVIHGSTQMTVTNDLAIHFLDDLDIKRFVLGRENSLSEIKLIKQATSKELEVFVHGALCVSYSGQCFTSETLGGRSANRGQCAQSCRFSYDLIVDGEKKNLVDRNYLVSPQDLCGIAEVPELMKIGVTSFKVEGRLKTPEFVATVASSYREVIDRTLAQNEIKNTDIEKFKSKMAIEYSRGFFSGWLNGVDHQQLVNGTFSSHRGYEIGFVKSILKNTACIELKTECDLQNGDGLLFVFKSEKNKVYTKQDLEKGSYIFSVNLLNKKNVVVTLANNFVVDKNLLEAVVYLNHAKNQKKEIIKSYQDKNYYKRIAIEYNLHFELGQPLRLEITDKIHSRQFFSEKNLENAINKGLSKDLVKDELNALGGTIYFLKNLNFSGQAIENLFIPNKEIKQLRQKATEWLDQVRKGTTIDGWNTESFDYKPAVKSQLGQQVEPKLVILLRERKQVEAICKAASYKTIDLNYIDSVILDFEFGRDYLDSLKILKDINIKVGIATTRILKPQEYNNLKIIKNLEPDFILARNLGAIQYFKNVNVFHKEIRGDFSLNISNHRTAEYFLAKGLSHICLSYDLNSNQVIDLLQNTNANRCEVTIHQSMPSFHMEHCVFAAFLSQGSSFKDCGKPCEKHRVQLKDQFGHHHWIKPDHECRNTMYNSQSQTALSFFQQWKEKNIGLVRYEALYENSYELIEKISAYINVLSNIITVDKALTQLKAVESYGLTSGRMAQTEEYQSRKKQI